MTDTKSTSVLETGKKASVPERLTPQGQEDVKAVIEKLKGLNPEEDFNKNFKAPTIPRVIHNHQSPKTNPNQNNQGEEK